MVTGQQTFFLPRTGSWIFFSITDAYSRPETKCKEGGWWHAFPIMKFMFCYNPKSTSIFAITVQGAPCLLSKNRFRHAHDPRDDKRFKWCMERWIMRLCGPVPNRVREQWSGTTAAFAFDTVWVNIKSCSGKSGSNQNSSNSKCIVVDNLSIICREFGSDHRTFCVKSEETCSSDCLRSLKIMETS